MNAIEFVKECGIDVAKRTLNNAINLGCAEIELFGGKYIFRTDNLKQIVEAFELVESKGGIKKARKEAGCLHSNDFDGAAFRIYEAINLVEQCQ